jgi:uncharacterized membrane protein (DUF2068 family)
MEQRQRQVRRRHVWLAAFFAFGAVMCVLTIVLLLHPGTKLDSLWRVNPAAHQAFKSLGAFSIVLMAIVGSTCASAAIGLWSGSVWGSRVAMTILAINLIGDVVNVCFRHDHRSLIGVPIAGAMIAYLIRDFRN